MSNYSYPGPILDWTFNRPIRNSITPNQILNSM